MKRTLTKLVCTIFTILLILSVLPVVFAEESHPEAVRITTSTISNPLYKETGKSTPKLYSRRLYSEEESYEEIIDASTTNYDALVSAFTEGMENRTYQISLYYASRTPLYSSHEVDENFSALINERWILPLFEDALEETDSPVQGDYLRWVWEQLYCSFEGFYDDESNMYYYKTVYYMTYYTTKEQEDQLTEAVNKVIDGFGFTEQTHKYEKISVIYDYITSNISYDYENLEDDTYLLKHTAYAAMMNKTAVCQGYALLYYRMAEQCGIDTRVIAGDGGGPHTWNISKLGKYYYNLDATWDAGMDEYSYFLRGSTDFGNHTPHTDYTTNSFKKHYPISSTYSKAPNPEDRNFSYQVSGSAAIITGYSGDALEITTPTTLDNYPVRCIGKKAFAGSKITSVIIGEGVYSIFEDAFSNSSLISISIPTSMSTIGLSAFSNCTNLRDVYYAGAQVQWNKISIDSNNDCLNNANIHYQLPCEHDFAPATCTKPKTCRICQETEGETLPHRNMLVLHNEDVHWLVCACGATDGITYEHTYKTQSDEQSHWLQCSCNMRKDVQPHEPDAGTIAADASCTSTGTKQYKCVHCNRFLRWEQIPKLPHDYADATYTKPKTCKTCGATEGEPLGVSISQQPQSVSVANGKTATISVTAIGEGLKYQWYYSWEGKFLACSGTGNSSYSITMNESRAGRQMYCVITDKYGNKVQSDTVTLGMKITITKQPVSVNAINGKTVSFSVAATGAGLKYQWYYSWEGEFLACSGTGKSSYSITMNKDRAGRQMYCVITDKFGNSVQTNTVTMYIGAMITQQPKTVPVKNGEKATISLSAIGEGLKYQWYYKYNGKFVKSSDVGQPTYSITMNKDRAGRQMYCVITDKFGNSVKSSTVTLGMAVSVSKQPVSVTVANGKTATVSVSATGEGLKYQWYYSWEGKFLACSGTGKSSYSIAMTESRAGRQMYCVITDKYGNKVQTDTVTLGMTFAITKQPTSTSAALGKSAKVSVTATGAGLKYQWYYSWEGEFLACSGTGKSSYSITMTEERAGRQMYCVITDKFGNSIQSNTVTLHKGPTITQQPKSVQVKNGAKATIGLTATGEGLKYQWYYKYNGKFVKSTDVGKATYSITMNKDRAGRQMYCIITDKFGTSVKSDVVTLGMAVSISTQPKTVTVAKGKTAKISVTATGDGLKYQWYYSWKGEFLKCSGAGKSSYSITMSKDRAGRQMYCVITDKYGNQVQTNTVTLKMK